jgi:hypothetical protein
MNSINAEMVFKCTNTLLSELVDGPAPGQGTWILDRDPSAGLAGTLDSLTAVQASRHIVPGESSIAGHANHLLFSLTLMNRWAAGENPFEGADWQGSWKIQGVDDAQWEYLRRKLREQGHAWMQVLNAAREWDEEALTGALASLAHLAYHLGAIRNTLEAAKKTATF